MAINVECEACFHTFRVADKFAGRTGKCPECGDAVKVPRGSQSAARASVQAAPAAPIARPASAKKKKKKQSSSSNSLGLMLGIGGAVVVVAGLVVFFMTRSGDEPAVADATPPAPSTDSAMGVEATPAAAPAAVAMTTPTPPTATMTPPAGTLTPPTGTLTPPAGTLTPPTATLTPPAGTLTPPALSAGAAAAITTTTPQPANAAVPAATSSAPSLPTDEPMSTPELVRRVEPSVVRINAISEDNELEWHGSGFLIDASGVVATNHHVVAGAHKCIAEFASGVKCEVKGFYLLDEKRDVALLQIDLPEGDYQALPLAAKPCDKGEQVMAFGCPYGLDFSTTDGLVSALRSASDIESMLGADVEGDWLQTSAPISPGNSGGPLVNMHGEVVGINSMVRTEGQNLNFAIAANDVRSMFDRRGEQLTALSRGTETKDGKVSLAGSRAAEKFLAKVDTVILHVKQVGDEADATIVDAVETYAKKYLRNAGIAVSGVKTIDSPLMLITVDAQDGVDAGTADVAVAAQLLVPVVQGNEVLIMLVWETHSPIASPKKFKLRKDPKGELKEGLTKFFEKIEREFNAAKKKSNG